MNRLQLQFLMLTFAGWVNRRQQDAVEYLRGENRPSPDAQLIGSPRVGGFHHRYVWQKAA